MEQFCGEWNDEVELYKLYPQNRERRWDMKNKVSDSIRDVSETQEPEDCYHQVSDTRHDLGIVALMHSRTIPIESYVSYIVHSVFDLPVSSI